MTLFKTHAIPGLAQMLVAGCVAFLLLGGTAFASPGAHGPNGEHLDAPGQNASPVGSAPSFEARSDLFELVGRLQGGELSMLINRFATNEPVLEAQVEVESGALKASAKFHADMGDYAVDDEAMLKLLGAPGEHPIIVTVLAGQDTDLLDGNLKVAAAAAKASAHAHDDVHSHGVSRTAWIIGVLVLLAGAAWLFGRTRRTRATSSNGGAL